MSLEEDPIDTVEQFAEETAENVAVQSEELSNELQKNLSDTDGDPCNSYEWSVIFLFVLVMALIAMSMHLWTLFKRRANLSAFDVLFLMLCVCTLIQFGPMLSQVLHSGHGVYHFSQSGCKLLFFTDYGMRHVIMAIVVMYFVYAYLILHHNFDPDNLDGKMKEKLPWIIILLVAIEGLFGMTAAVYVDVGPKTLQSCIWTPTMKLGPAHIISLEMICRPITPYLLPLAVIFYPLFRATQTVRSMDESKVKSTLFTIMVIVWSFFVMNLPYAILLVTESSAQISQSQSINWVVVCNFKWAFFLLHQAWFLVVPVTVVSLDVERGNNPPGTQAALKAWGKVRREVDQRIRMA